jgi:hypothetical protein
VSAFRCMALVVATGCLSKPSFECSFVPLTTYDLDAHLGTQDGGGHTPSLCSEGVVVGIELSMTRTPNGTYNEKTAVSTALHCATVSTHDGDHATGPITKLEVPDGFAERDGPFPADCAPGQVVVGLAAHRVATDRDHLFNSFAIDCSTVDETGAPTGVITEIAIGATGITPADSRGRCRDGEVLRGVKAYTGSELDRVDLACGEMACPPP